MSICAAHCSWVCCSRSTNRMASYSSSVSRIGSVSSHPLGQKVSTCGAPQIRRHRGGLGMNTPPLFSVYTDYITMGRKRQYSFQEPLQFPSTYRYGLIFGVECYHCAAGKMEGHSGGMKKLHNTVLQAVIGQLGVIKSNLEGLLPTEDQQGHECITDAIGSVKDAIGDIEEAMD